METALVNGLVGGLVATVVMTVFMMALGDDSPPPTSTLWAKFIGDEGPEAYLPQGMLLHMLYGIGAGGAFGVLLVLIGIAGADILVLTAAGLGYGIALFAVGAVFWMKIALALEPTRSDVGHFLLFHLIYGIVLGPWMAVGIPL